MPTTNARNTMRFRAGLLDFGLAASKLEGQYQLKCRLATMNVLLHDYKDYKATTCAVLNMKGLLLYYLHEYHHARDTFEEILTLDETNLNAIKNLQLLYRELGLQSEADKREHDAEILEKICTPSDGVSRVEATFLAEQAFSILFDCHISVINSERYRKARFLLKRCLECKGMPEIDVMQWKYWFAQLVFKDNTFKSCSDIQEIISDYLEPITNADDNDLDVLKVAACTLKGQLQSKKLRDAELATASFEHALSIRTGKWTELNTRYSLFLTGGNCSMESRHMAKRLIDECLSDDCEKVNCCSNLNEQESLKLSNEAVFDVHQAWDWFPYSVRCRVYLGLFMANCRHCKHLISNISKNTDRPKETCLPQGASETSEHCNGYESCDLSVLDTAIESGEKCVNLLGDTVENFNNIGVAYHLKALHETDGEKRRGYYFSALSHFSHALKHLDGAKIPYVHIGHGECLLDMHEYRPAIECFKRAISCETKNKDIYSVLLEGYVQLLIKETRHTDNCHGNSKVVEGILSEASHWLLTLPNKKDQSINVEAVLLKFCDSIKDNEAKANAFASIVSAMFTRRDKTDHLNDLLDNFLGQHKLFAVKVSAFLMKIPHVDREYMYKVFKLFDDAFFEKNTLDAEKMFADALLFYRHTCCEVDCHFVNKRFDYRAVKVFQEMSKCFKSFSKNIIEEVKKRDARFANVLSHYLHDGTEDADSVEITSEDHWASEITVAIHQEIRKDKPVLSRCLSRIENDLLGAIDDHITRKQLCQVNCNKPKCRTDEYEFDFFVLHGENDDDRNFVINDLVPTLEKRYGFKGCFEDRDFMPGKPQLSELESKMSQSYKVLIVLTNEFMEDNKCELFIGMSVNMKKDSVIPVDCGKMEKDKIPKALKTLVMVKQFDMERLTKALESTAY